MSYTTRRATRVGQRFRITVVKCPLGNFRRRIWYMARYFVITDGIATSHLGRHDVQKPNEADMKRERETHTERDLLMQRLSATLTCYAATARRPQIFSRRTTGVDCAVLVINCRRNDDGKLDAIADWISSAWKLWQTDWPTLIHCKLPASAA